jgi:BirA family biotin operon repressor/biotin-[acetyl-CoA-carboxylase] ligase
MTDVDIDNPLLFYYPEVDSTMDSAKSQANSVSNVLFGVYTPRQLKGRGTRGRSWQSVDGNLFMTVGIPTDRINIPLHLCPLRVGTLILPSIQRRINSVAYLKWPNDVLINDDKVCGILIEVENGYMYAGIGCNIVGSPPIPTEGADAGRDPTCKPYNRY